MSGETQPDQDPTDVALSPAIVSVDQAEQFAIVCAACRRPRTLADDYDYNPLQLVTGRPLGWFNGDGEQMCGDCLGKTMKGQIP